MTNKPSIERTIKRYRAGQLQRREFLQRMLALGVTPGLAASIATVYG